VHVGVWHNDAAGATVLGGTATYSTILQVRRRSAPLREACAHLAVVSTALQIRKRLAALQVRRRSPVGGTARSAYVHVGVQHNDAVGATALGGTVRGSCMHVGVQHNLTRVVMFGGVTINS